MQDRGWARPEEPPDDPRPVGTSWHPGLLDLGGAEGRWSPDAVPVEDHRRSRPVRPIPDLAVWRGPATLIDLLDGAFMLIKARPRVVVGMAAMIVVPIALLVSIRDVGLLGGDGLATLTDPETYEPGTSEQAGVDWAPTVVAGVVQSLIVTLLAAPLARLVAAWRRGEDPSALGVMATMGRRWVSLVVAFVAVHVVEFAASILLVLPGIAAMVLFGAVAPIVGVEDLGPVAAMRRSVRLCRRRFLPVFWSMVLVGIVSSLLLVLLPALPVVVVAIVGAGDVRLVASIGTVAAGLVVSPFVAGVAVLVHLDLAARVDGADIEREIHDVFGSEGYR